MSGEKPTARRLELISIYEPEFDDEWVAVRTRPVETRSDAGFSGISCDSALTAPYGQSGATEATALSVTNALVKKGDAKGPTKRQRRRA